jgi:hypothetical protein
MTIPSRIGALIRWIRALPSLLAVCVVALLASLTFSANAFAAEAGSGLRLTVGGDATTVLSKSQNACDPADIPDAPARAIRIVSGTVQLYATHFHNRRLVGPDLLHLSNDCHIIFAGGERDDPAAFDDRAWIASLYTEDGRTIFAAVHNEFQGHRRPALCPSGRYMDCWYNAVTAAVSRDEGAHFSRLVADADLIAALPYRYAEVTGRHAGYFNPSNMVLQNGMLSMMVFATGVRAQRSGNCLLRTDRISDPSAWRAWDGTGYGVSFVDPYGASVSPDAHVCEPVGAGKLRWPVTSLVRHAPTGLFIALMMNAARDGGVFYSTSPDLLDWSSPAKLMGGSGGGVYQCGDPAPLAYPSLLDPNSEDRNFMTVGKSAELFLARFNVTDCRISMDRDLIRMPIAISADRN